MVHQLEWPSLFDWLRAFLSAWNNDVYFRSRPSMGTAASGRPFRQKVPQAIKC